MNVEALERWLRKQLTHEANVCLALSPLCVLGGLAVLFLTFWISYAVIWMVLQVVLAIPSLLFNTTWTVGHAGRLWATGAFMVLLVHSYSRTDRWRSKGFESFDAQNPSALGQSLARFGAGRASLLLLHPEASASLIVDFLFVGPQLLWGGVGLIRESGRSRSADCSAGARVLWTLLAQPHKVGYDDLTTLYEAAELKRAMEALKQVPGVHFLEQGITLTADLRVALARAEAAN